MVKKIDNEIAAYIAGLLDGEGCFRLQRFPTNRSPIGFQYRTVVEVTMCDLDTIQYVQSATGRKTIQKRKLRSGRTAYKLIWYNSHAADLIRAILPYLRGKKAQAELCLHFEENVTPGRGKSYRPEDKALCESIRQRLTEFKQLPIAAD